jgi:hypothetical protein
MKDDTKTSPQISLIPQRGLASLGRQPKYVCKMPNCSPAHMDSEAES